MKRRVQLARGAPLVARRGLAPGKGLARSASKPREPAQPRQETRTRPSGRTGVPPDARDTVRARSGGCCELQLPDVCLGPGHNRHHRLPRRMGGSRAPGIHSPANLLDLCGSGTTGCHGYLEQHRQQAIACGWLIPSGGDPATTPALLAGRWVFLTPDGAYADTPPSGALHV